MDAQLSTKVDEIAGVLPRKEAALGRSFPAPDPPLRNSLQVLDETNQIVNYQLGQQEHQATIRSIKIDRNWGEEMGGFILIRSFIRGAETEQDPDVGPHHWSI